MAFGGAATTYQGRLHVIGGEAGPPPLGTWTTHEAYNPATNTWESLAPMPTARHGLGVGTIGNLLFAATGGPGAGATYGDVLEAFELPAPCSPRPRVTVQTSRVGSGRLLSQIAASPTGAVPNNHLVRLDVTRLDNAAVDVRTFVDHRQPFSLGLPDRPTTIAVTVQRLTPGQFSARVTAFDDCGAWPTFIGGGNNVP